MTREEISNLLKQIKTFYPRFEGVEKEGKFYEPNNIVIDAWYQRLGWMEYERAIKILDRYMESEAGSKVPSIALWMNNGKAQRKSDDYVSATWDARNQCIRWQPDPEGKVYERKASWNSQKGCYEDDDGYLWAFAED